MAIGLSPLSSTYFGFGTITTTTTDRSEKLFPRTDGTQGSANQLTADGEYEVDERGRPVGMSVVGQKVFLHLFTERGSTPDLDFGRRPFPRVLTDKTLPLFELVVRDALSPMIAGGEIDLVGVTTELGNHGRIGLRVEWMDLTTRQKEALSI